MSSASSPASSSSKPRTLPPFRPFLKPPSLPSPDVAPHSHSHSHSPSTLPHGSASPADFLSRAPSMLGGRPSSSPAKGRPFLPPLAPPTPRNLRFGAESSAAGSGSPSDSPTFERIDASASVKENATVTVRFRPLSPRETQRGDEVAWYADGETTVCSEHNPAISYAFDRVFGPATTTRHVYDVAVQHIVDGAMEGINGTVFAYGVTNSGKTHTMHGDQKSPGIIPLAVKDVFSFIQETPRREFLLRVSYLEIYNEVINDLLDPAGQNLRIREDVQGTYVEGIKEEVVLSPAHCLSLIAAGEEHRHVGSNNFNLLSSRSHTILTLTIESSPRGDNFCNEEVTLSQLNLIDLAGSEGSKAETAGLLWKEGSYVNKSLLTLGTVISKLTDGKSTHVPYRDSKLTRLLQSSLNGHGRISLICTVTPSSISNEETHNTLKFAHKAKNVQIHASQNKIVIERSLIKKYQREISRLKVELEQVKRGMASNAYLVESQEDRESLRQQLDASQVQLQSRLEEEEQAKAALVGRIQRLTKLILVSTKSPVSQNLCDTRGNQRRHSFGEEELAYLPDRRRELVYEDDGVQGSEPSVGGGRNANIISDDILNGDKRQKKRSMLAWFKMKKNEQTSSAVNLESEDSSNMSSATREYALMHVSPGVDRKDHRKYASQRVDDIGAIDLIREGTQAGELLSATAQGWKPPLTGITMVDQMDLLKEQVKILAGDVALCTISMKQLSEQAVTNPDDSQHLMDEIREKKRRMHELERQILENSEITFNSHATSLGLSQCVSNFSEQLNEKSNELEIKTADNKILPDRLTAQGTLKATDELTLLKVQLLQQMKDIERLKEENEKLQIEKDELQVQGTKLEEESSCAKELASAAAVELKNLAEEVTKLCYQNTKLAAELSSTRESAHVQPARKSVARRRMSDTNLRRLEEAMNEELTKELLASKEREITLEAALAERESKNAELQKKLEEEKRRGTELENNLKSMWVLVAKLKKLKGINSKGGMTRHEHQELLDLPGMINANATDMNALKEALDIEKNYRAQLEMLISQLKSEDLSGLDLAALEDLSALHMEALTRLRHAKASLYGNESENGVGTINGGHAWRNANGMCRMCSGNSSAILLPCCQFLLCKSCAIACTECPLCKTTIKEIIVI